MTEVTQAPEAGDQDAGPAETGGVSWLDWAGGAAAVILVVIVADIFSDGRLVSVPLRRWFARRQGGGGGEVQPGAAGGD